MYIETPDYSAKEREIISTSTTAKSLSASKYVNSIGEKAKVAIISVTADVISITLDGTTPTDAIGHIFEERDILKLNGHTNIKQFQFKNANTGVNAEIQVTYFF